MKKINIEIKVRCWKDKLTGSWLIYSKKYDISSYGETKAKARSMFNVIIAECLMYTKRKVQAVSKSFKRRHH